MGNKHNKHNKHNKATALIIATVLVGSCMAMGFKTIKGRDIEKITGKRVADKIERIWDKAGTVFSRSGEVAEKAKRAADRLIEKAGGTEEITKRIKHMISQYSKGRKLDSASDIELTALDNYGYAYRFTYGGENFRAVYTASFDTWTIYDSYKITNDHDLKIICQALIDEHPVHGKDLVSYRTADDMAYEWQQHNIVYELLPDNNRWKSSARDVDLDPYDQGKSYKEIYEDRTGKKFDFKNFV